MSYEKKETFMGENKSILAFAGELFQNIPVIVTKTNVAAYLTDDVLKAGTPISKDGKVVDGTTVTADKAIGLLYRDINFKYSNGNESVPVTIFGFVKESALPALVTAGVKTALKMIQIL
jgi:hypothetical protein